MSCAERSRLDRAPVTPATVTRKNKPEKRYVILNDAEQTYAPVPKIFGKASISLQKKVLDSPDKSEQNDISESP